MNWVLLAVACSVLVSVLLKLAPRWRLEVTQMVVWNYVVASLATALLLRPSLAPLAGAGVPWFTLGALGLLLPSIFLVLAAAIASAGIVRSDAAQRLSLLLPLLAAFLFFGERLTVAKLAGCAVGLVALGAMTWREGGGGGGGGGGGRGLLWLPAVFAGFGIIDILFKRLAAHGLPLGASLQVVFGLALPVAFAIVFARRVRLDARSLAAGLLLGLLNFGNILFYLKAHRTLPGSPALVFASMNLGVVALGALVGMVLFRERLSRLNLAGLGLAGFAIAVLAFA